MNSTGVERLIKPKLKSFDCTDHDPIEDWQPDSDSVRFELALHIGAADDDAADLYQVSVFTRRGLADAKQDGVDLGGPAPILLDDYSWRAVLTEIEVRIGRCDGFGWMDVQEKLRSEFRWEYEGMS